MHIIQKGAAPAWSRASLEFTGDHHLNVLNVVNPAVLSAILEASMMLQVVYLVDPCSTHNPDGVN